MLINGYMQQVELMRLAAHPPSFIETELLSSMGIYRLLLCGLHKILSPGLLRITEGQSLLLLWAAGK
jgi:hypothetical protein